MTCVICCCYCCSFVSSFLSFFCLKQNKYVGSEMERDDLFQAFELYYADGDLERCVRHSVTEGQKERVIACTHHCILIVDMDMALLYLVWLSWRDCAVIVVVVVETG